MKKTFKASVTIALKISPPDLFTSCDQETLSRLKKRLHDRMPDGTTFKEKLHALNGQVCPYLLTIKKAQLQVQVDN